MNKARLLSLMLLMSGNFAQAQEREVSGRVTSANDASPIAGVNIIVSGTTVGTVILVGKIPGVQIFSFSGTSLSEISFALRGINTINHGTLPMIQEGRVKLGITTNSKSRKNHYLDNQHTST